MCLIFVPFGSLSLILLDSTALHLRAAYSDICHYTIRLTIYSPVARVESQLRLISLTVLYCIIRVELIPLCA